MSRHRAGKVPDGDTAPVLSGQRRGLAAILVSAVTLLAACGFYVNRTVAAPPWKIANNASPAIPREIASEMGECVRPASPMPTSP